jgi:hypothetical protein
MLEEDRHGNPVKLEKAMGRMELISCARRRKSASSPKPNVTRSTWPIKPSPTSVPVDLKAPRFSCHKQTLFPLRQSEV